MGLNLLASRLSPEAYLRWDYDCSVELFWVVRFVNEDLRSGYLEDECLIASGKLYLAFGELFLVLCLERFGIRVASVESRICSDRGRWAKNFRCLFICDDFVCGWLELVHSAFQRLIVYEANEIERKRLAHLFELCHFLARSVWRAAVIREAYDWQ